MGNEPRLKLKINTGDRVYLKDTFEKYFSKYSTGITYRPDEMNIFRGQQVIVTSLVTTYAHKKVYHSFTCRMTKVHGSREIRLPIVCINRSQPLIRNGKKISLIHKELYIRLT